MTLPSFGVPLSLNQIHVEVGGTSGTTVSLNETDVRGLISKGLNASNSISDYYGASAAPSSPIIAGDGYFLLMHYAPPYTQGLPMAIWVGHAVLKLGGNVVKGNFGSFSSWNSGQHPNPGTAATFFSNLTYTHTDGNAYVPATPVNPNNSATWPPAVTYPTFAQNTYDNRGVQ